MPTVCRRGGQEPADMHHRRCRTGLNSERKRVLACIPASKPMQVVASAVQQVSCKPPADESEPGRYAAASFKSSTKHRSVPQVWLARPLPDTDPRRRHRKATTINTRRQEAARCVSGLQKNAARMTCHDATGADKNQGSLDQPEHQSTKLGRRRRCPLA